MPTGDVSCIAVPADLSVCGSAHPEEQNVTARPPGSKQHLPDPQLVPLLSGASMPGVTRPLPKECSHVLFAPVVASRKVIKAL